VLFDLYNLFPRQLHYVLKVVKAEFKVVYLVVVMELETVKIFFEAALARFLIYAVKLTAVATPLA
jgi:hypothetical protein